MSIETIAARVEYPGRFDAKARWWWYVRVHSAHVGCVKFGGFVASEGLRCEVQGLDNCVVVGFAW